MLAWAYGWYGVALGLFWGWYATSHEQSDWWALAIWLGGCAVLGILSGIIAGRMRGRAQGSGPF